MTVLELPTPDPRTLDDTSRPFAEAVASHYAIKKMIGRGGMGLVYLARDKRLDRLVAIKTLLPDLAADAAVRERFLRETRTAGGMSHPNIVPIHGADEIGGHVFFVMAYVDGESLASHIRAHSRLAPRVVAEHLRDVASALSHAHRRGIIHRDIKAENILIERSSSRALVTDFGIARLAEAQPLTATGQLLGTVYYVSPEQVSGERIDARSDLYSLGVVGFLALTGNFPFDAEVASAVLVAHVTKAAPAVASINPSVPASLAAIIDRCLAKKPSERFASADELIAALDGAIRQMDGDVSSVAAPRLVSDTEAHAIFERAAELQALTGIQPRPAALPQARDANRDRMLTSGFRVDDLRAAASEAGIDSRYVEHAMIERGVVPPQASASVQRPHQRRSWWASVPLTTVEEAVVAGEMPARDFDRLLGILHEATGRLGTSAAKTRELSWSGKTFGSRLNVSVIPDRGTTSVRVTQNTRRTAIAAFVGSTAVVGGMIGPAIAGIVDEIMKYPAPTGGIRLPIETQNTIVEWIVGAGFLVALPVGRWVARRLHQRTAARLRAITEAVVAKVRDSIDHSKARE